MLQQTPALLKCKCYAKYFKQKNGNNLCQTSSRLTICRNGLLNKTNLSNQYSKLKLNFRLKKLEEARQRRKIEREQAKKRLQLEIQENKQRRAQLKNSMTFFQQIRESSDAIKMADKNQHDWDKFMRCNGLPNSNSPSDLRKYIHQWQIDIERRNRESRNWLLKTNERTLLTQDTTVPDLTQATLRKQQGNLGDVYAQRVKEILGVDIKNMLKKNLSVTQQCIRFYWNWKRY